LSPLPRRQAIVGHAGETTSVDTGSQAQMRMEHEAHTSGVITVR
jgi:hypothetical protein